jgi:hypothetical protein
VTVDHFIFLWRVVDNSLVFKDFFTGLRLYSIDRDRIKRSLSVVDIKKDGCLSPEFSQ